MPSLHYPYLKRQQKYPFITARNAAKHVLNEYLDGYCLSCIDHVDIVKRAAVQYIINIFYNNKQKAEGDIPRKDNLKSFKKSNDVHAMNPVPEYIISTS